MTEEEKYPQELDATPEFTEKEGDVSYICSFPGGFVKHTLAQAVETAERLRNLGAMGVYRIELVALYDHKPDEAPPPPLVLDPEPPTPRLA
jgi:hypothetical protein